MTEGGGGGGEGGEDPRPPHPRATTGSEQPGWEEAPPPPLPPVATAGHDAMLPPVSAPGADAMLPPMAPDAWLPPAAAASAAAMPPPLRDADEPPLPAAYDAGDAGDALRDAVGAPPPRKHRRAATPPPVVDADDDDDDDAGDGRRRSKKSIAVAAVSLVVGLSIAALVFLGRANSARYRLSCEATRVVVERGRAFPPWGTRELLDPTWKAVAIPAEAECHPRETEDEAELASWYGKLLVDQASGLLQAREVTKVDEAEVQLRQALLVLRLLASDEDRKNQRKDIERMLGDVAYWRASAKLHAAVDALGDAAKDFEAAALQRPRYVDDASAWASYVREVAGELRTGPAGAKAPASPTVAPVPPDHVPAPAGVALPVEPGPGSAEAPPAAPPVDAGLPTGGVLL